MKILKFDDNAGIYITEIRNIDTAIHQHPAIEIIIAEEGSFDLFTVQDKYYDQKFAIIRSNHDHRLSCNESKIKIMLIEFRDKSLDQIMINEGTAIFNGVYSSRSIQIKLLEKINAFLIGGKKDKYDPRVMEVIQLLSTQNNEYKELMSKIKDTIYLSESRISHIFKKEVGISIKKYFVWSKLKKSINQFIMEETDLNGISLKNGFYDQAHFNHVYKDSIGLSPIKTYKNLKKNK